MFVVDHCRTFISSIFTDLENELSTDLSDEGFPLKRIFLPSLSLRTFFFFVTSTLLRTLPIYFNIYQSFETLELVFSRLLAYLGTSTQMFRLIRRISYKLTFFLSFFELSRKWRFFSSLRNKYYALRLRRN